MKELEQGAIEQGESGASEQEARDPNVAPDADRAEFPQSEHSNELPEWVKLPGNLDVPKGAPVGFMRFPSGWTMTPHIGDRQCVVWPLTDLDERIAFARIKDNFGNAGNELAKQMLRAVDGVRVDWGARAGAPGNPHDFWRDIGAGCRKLVIQYYNKTHALEPAQITFFMENCVAVRSMG